MKTTWSAAKVPPTTSMSQDASHPNHVRNWVDKHVSQELEKLVGKPVEVTSFETKRAPRGGLWGYLVLKTKVPGEEPVLLRGTAKVSKEGGSYVRFKRGNMPREGEIWLARAGFRWSRHQKAWVHTIAGETKGGKLMVKRLETETVDAKKFDEDGNSLARVVDTIHSDAWLRMLEADDPNDFGEWGPVGWMPDPKVKGRYTPATMGGKPMARPTRTASTSASAPPRKAEATGRMLPRKGKKASKWKALAKGEKED